MTTAQGTRWCFTLNNYTQAEHDLFKMLPAAEGGAADAWGDILRGGFATEVGDSGTPHLQGWVIFKTNRRMNALKKLCPRIHLELMKGSEQANFDYCNEEVGEPHFSYHEYGPPKESEQGKRTDLDETIEYIVQFGKRAAAIQHPGTYAKHYKGIDHVVALRQEEYKPPMIEGMFAWQKALADELLGEPDDRTIHWVFDREGGHGKTTLAKHLINFGAVILAGRIADMSFMYNKEPIVIFDLARADNIIDSEANAYYSFAEKLKNGCVVSTKYESKPKYFKPPHVVFFSNSPAPVGIWTADRLKQINL